MKLSLKITVALFLMTAIFIAVLTGYFTNQINKNFQDQADRLLNQSVGLTNYRMELLKQQLQSEMNSLAESFFTENENILAAILGEPPVWNAEVIGFAEKLRRRTTLDFLYLTSSNGTILSNSREPAAYGIRDPLSDAPANEPSLAKETDAVLFLRQPLRFGKYLLYLRGGYVLRNRIHQASFSGLQLSYQEESPTTSRPETSALQQTIEYKDYLGKPVAFLTVSVSQQELLKQKEEILRNSLYLLIGSLLFCLLIGWLLSLSISSPLNRLTKAAQTMSSGNFNVRVQRGGDKETGKLIDAFNAMTEQLEENRKKLIQTERIAAWQEIARHLAHEIKNPLTPIRTSITNLRLAMERAPEKFPEIFRESSESVIEEVEALRRLADEFARFARLPEPQRETQSLNDTVQRIITLYKNSLPENIRMNWNAGEVPLFSFDPGQISQVVQNLLQNSIEALVEGGSIQVTTSTSNHNEKQWASIVISDDGPGMTEQIRQHVFTPYFTTKQKGTGLGLAIAFRIVTEHGGNILVESEPGKGTRFEVLLPL